MCADIYRAKDQVAERKREPLAHAGYFRNADQDSGLLSAFGLTWKAVVEPMLDSEGWLSPEGAERLLRRLKDHEHVFELKLAKLPPDEQEHQRGRYALWKGFLISAIAESAPIYTVV